MKRCEAPTLRAKSSAINSLSSSCDIVAGELAENVFKLGRHWPAVSRASSGEMVSFGYGRLRSVAIKAHSAVVARARKPLMVQLRGGKRMFASSDLLCVGVSRIGLQV